jgi:hypothetical protein
MAFRKLPGERGRHAPHFLAPRQKLIETRAGVSREARDTAGEAPALPRKSSGVRASASAAG